MKLACIFLVHEPVISLEIRNKTEKTTDSSAKNPALEIVISTGTKKLQEQQVKDMISKSQQTTQAGGEGETGTSAKGIPSVCHHNS